MRDLNWLLGAFREKIMKRKLLFRGNKLMVNVKKEEKKGSVGVYEGVWSI